MLITLVITAVVVGLGFLHSRLSRLPSPALGAVVPALFAALVVVAFTKGVLDSPIDYAMAALGTLVLLGMWGEGRAWRTTRAAA